MCSRLDSLRLTGSRAHRRGANIRTERERVGDGPVSPRGWRGGGGGGVYVHSRLPAPSTANAASSPSTVRASRESSAASSNSTASSIAIPAVVLAVLSSPQELSVTEVIPALAAPSELPGLSQIPALPAPPVLLYCQDYRHFRSQHCQSCQHLQICQHYRHYQHCHNYQHCRQLSTATDVRAGSSDSTAKAGRTGRAANSVSHQGSARGTVGTPTVILGRHSRPLRTGSPAGGSPGWRRKWGSTRGRWLCRGEGYGFAVSVNQVRRFLG